MAFGEIDPQCHKFWLSIEFLKVYVEKKLAATILFVDFAKAFDSIHRGKMEQILLTYGLPKETVAAIMMLCRITTVKVCSLDGDTDYFNIAAGVLQGDILAPYQSIICLKYVLRTSIDKWNTTVSSWQRKETLLHSLEQAVAGIGLHVNAHKTEYMCFNQTGDISTQSSRSLKLVVHLPRKQCFINRDRHQHVTSKGMDNYW